MEAVGGTPTRWEIPKSREDGRRRRERYRGERGCSRLRKVTGRVDQATNCDEPALSLAGQDAGRAIEGMRRGGGLSLASVFFAAAPPSSIERFGQWLTNAEIESLVAPDAVELATLYSTLAHHGLDH